MDNKSNISYCLTTSIIVGSGHVFHNITRASSFDDAISLIKEYYRICVTDSIDFHLTIDKSLPFDFSSVDFDVDCK